ncbi:histamine H3 receptor-like isoform X2 [Symsagittifera roscoffensis]|uniref:histamine H3 receptor-like isoform X2 n=1 Tax=Symsagittifera roscoffensis TaxID=84072 RepID=UPI00307C3AB6
MADCSSSDPEVAADSEEPYYSTMASVVIICVAILLIIVTIIGNLSVVIAFFQDKRLQTPSNYPLISLSVSDLLVGCFIFPCSVVYKTTGNWYLGRPLCVVWLCCDYMATSTSVFALIMITFDRYLTITRLQSQDSPSKKGAAVGMICVLWLIPALTYIPITVFWPLLDSSFSVQALSCDEGWITFMPFVLPVTIFMTYCPLLCLIFFNAKIFITLRTNAKAVEKSESKSSGGGGQEGGPGTPTFAGKARAVLAIIRTRKLARESRGAAGEEERGVTDPEQAKELAEKSKALERELQAKRISTFKSNLNHRKLGPQNKSNVWDRFATSVAAARRQSNLDEELSPVVKNAPIIFSTRTQNILLDAVINGNSEVTVGRNPGAKFSKASSVPRPDLNLNMNSGTVSSHLAGKHSMSAMSGVGDSSPFSKVSFMNQPSNGGVHMADVEVSTYQIANTNHTGNGIGSPKSTHYVPMSRCNSKHNTPATGNGVIHNMDNELTSPTSDLNSCQDESAYYNESTSQLAESRGSTKGGSVKLGGSLGGSGRSRGNQMSDGTRNRQLRRQQRNMTIFKTIIVLVCVYIICCCPFSVITFLDLVSSVSVPKFWWDMSVWFLYLNSALNPILYVYRNMPFRNAIRKLYSCCLPTPGNNTSKATTPTQPQTPRA